MKKIVVIALSLFTLISVAQEKRKHKTEQKNGTELRKQMTPNDIADLKSKKLTLKLDLTDAQQKKVHALILNQVKARKALKNERKAKDGEKKEKPSKDDIVKMQNRRLDQQIAMKRKMKTILTAEQYAKFEKIKPRKNKKRRKHSKISKEKR